MADEEVTLFLGEEVFVKKNARLAGHLQHLAAIQHLPSGSRAPVVSFPAY